LGHDDDRLRSREAGFDGHVIKPADFGELTRLLDTLRPMAQSRL
jgi:DNA-binding response OmpR family regulator